MPFLYRPTVDLRERVWGGRRLGPPRQLSIGEAWLAGPGSLVADGPDAGLTLAEVAARDGAAFVGHDAVASTGSRVPLLVKLLDPLDWLSVQVHPDDPTARALEGPDAMGKTEAWYVVDAAADAALLLGVAEGVDDATVRAAIADAPGSPQPRVAPLLRRVTPEVGKAYLVPAGVLHAVGPGALLYELQQASDITYRCEDWGRPSGPERPLHTRQSLVSLASPEVASPRVASPAAASPRVASPASLAAPSAVAEPATGQARQLDGASSTVLVACQFFVMECVQLDPGAAFPIEPAGRSMHIVTTLGPIRVDVPAAAGQPAEHAALDTWQTVVVAASTPSYVLEAGAATTVLVARVPSPSDALA